MNEVITLYYVTTVMVATLLKITIILTISLEKAQNQILIALQPKSKNIEHILSNNLLVARIIMSVGITVYFLI